MSKVYSNIHLFSQSILRAAACPAIALFIFTTAASAATYTVDTTVDNAALTACTVAAGDCSLRGAIARANATTTEADTIDFALPANSTITLTGGMIRINNAGALTITNSSGASNLMISGNNASRIFLVLPSANLTLNAITVTQGRANSGGGILNNGTLSLTNSTVSGNVANPSFHGGGIYNERNSTTTLTNSTVSGNTGQFGGGIYNFEGTINLNSVTVAYNRANSFGGGVYTFSGPVYTATVNLRNTIVANNSAGSASPDFHNAIAPASSFNLIGSGTGMTGITNGTGGNQVGIDPKLDPALALNGSKTPNHALLPGSPAIDKGSATGTDQRGLTRPVDNPSIANAAGGNGADIGAFEVQFAPTAASVSVSGRVITQSGRGIRNVVITMTDSTGSSRTATTTSFGYYRFDDVRAGETYILSAVGKRYTFSQPSQVLNINEDTEAVNFIADSNNSRGNF